MSNKTKDILDEILDVEESTVELVEKKLNTLTIKRDDIIEDLDTDYKYQRENFYSLIEREIRCPLMVYWMKPNNLNILEVVW